MATGPGCPPPAPGSGKGEGQGAKAQTCLPPFTCPSNTPPPSPVTPTSRTLWKISELGVLPPCRKPLPHLSDRAWGGSSTSRGPQLHQQPRHPSGEPAARAERHTRAYGQCLVSPRRSAAGAPCHGAQGRLRRLCHTSGQHCPKMSPGTMTYSLKASPTSRRSPLLYIKLELSSL